MRDIFYLLLGLILVTPIFGEENKPMPWLGVSIHHPDSRVERPAEMGEGTGLLVHQVVSGGPLAHSGSKKGDFWWKMNDQILVNRGQLVVLLKLHAPGDKVSFQFFREGQLMTLDVILGIRPEHSFSLDSNSKRAFDGRSANCEIEEVAEMTSGGFHYHLEDGKNGLRARISKNDEILFEGPIAGVGSSSELKPQWNGALLILRQALAARKGGPMRAVRARKLPQKSN